MEVDVDFKSDVEVAVDFDVPEEAMGVSNVFISKKLLFANTYIIENIFIFRI